MRKSKAQIQRSLLRTKHRQAQKRLREAEIHLKELNLNYNNIYVKKRYWQDKYELLKVLGTEKEECEALINAEKHRNDLENLKNRRSEIKEFKRQERAAWKAFLNNEPLT